VQYEVNNLVVFKRLLGQVDGLDPSLPQPEVVRRQRHTRG
jgi:hypothetical protein